jgi:xylan 1,4-beta-xylosidase
MPGLLQGLPAEQAALREPSIPGDHPDPSVIRVGKEYWATSTSGDWAPAFPLFRSTSSPDAWRQVGSIFETPPAWAKGDFWAPELVNDRGHILAYYTARNANGLLCVAVATANIPQGPYTDHGPLVCQPDGSIDASFIRNRDGQPYLIWKEDGNSRKQPTPIWAQPLSADGLKLEGKPTELIRNDAAWEGGVVEAPYILRRGGWFYLFYAGNACCGMACHYAEGVARSRTLLGPWEKDPANPIIHDGDGWRCPGHGTAVESPSTPGHTWFLLHAYSNAGGVYVAREAVVVSIAWENGWPVVANGELPVANRLPVPFVDSFSGKLKPGWQWPLGKRPAIRIGGGSLSLGTTALAPTVVLARVIDASPYSARVVLHDVSIGAPGFAGLAVVGNHRGLSVGWQQDHVVLREQTADKANVLARSDGSARLPIELRVEASEPEHPIFSWREPGGPWHRLQPGLNSDSLVGWDSGLRVGMLVNGPSPSTATFTNFRR